IMPNTPLSGQIALVTGASRGIGAAIVAQLARDGAQVIGTATTDAGAEKISEQLAGHGLAGRGYAVDVNDREAVSTLLADVGKEFGAPSIVVNNAGITRDTLLMRMREEDWQAVIDANLSGVFRVCKACLRGMMKARCGRIVNIGSVVGLMGNSG